MLRISLIILCYLASVACQQPTSSGSGSLVGNGMVKFKNSLHDYTFRYNRALNLNDANLDAVSVDNFKYAQALNKPVSSISFQVVPYRTESVADLYPYGDTINSDKLWIPVTITGIDGVYFKSNNSYRLEASYIFRLGSSALLHVTIDAYAAAGGQKLLAPIIDSLAFDTKSPIIHEMHFDPPQIEAGESARLLIRITDNLSGVRGTDHYGNVRTSFERDCRFIINADSHSLDQCSELVHVHDDWYALEVLTNTRIPPGKYSYLFLDVWDGSGNPKSLVYNKDSGSYEHSTGDRQDSVSVAPLVVSNDSPDVTPPVVERAVIEPSVVPAGETAELIVSVTDDDPEFRVEHYCASAWHRDSFKFQRTDLESDVAIDEFYMIKICGQVEYTSESTWRLPFETNKHLPPGTYSFSLELHDFAGNRVEQNRVEFTVETTNEVDLAAPEVLAIKASRAQYRPGDSGSILVKVRDNLSGIAVASDIYYKSCQTGIVPMDWDREDRNDMRRTQLCPSQFRHVAADWYAFDFKLGENIPTGEYYLSQMDIKDKVGNRAVIVPKIGEPLSHRHYHDLFTHKSNGIPLLKIKVVR